MSHVRTREVGGGQAMSDRLAEIKARAHSPAGPPIDVDLCDLEWLIDEVERLRSENWKLLGMLSDNVHSCLDERARVKKEVAP